MTAPILFCAALIVCWLATRRSSGTTPPVQPRMSKEELEAFATHAKLRWKSMQGERP